MRLPYPLLKMPKNGSFGLRADDTIYFLSAFQYQKRRNALHTKACGGFGIFIHVHLSHANAAGHFGR
jgi:hypothetical protein